MDLSLERESTAIGSLFQQIISDMKNSSPLWDDFIVKATKLHACLRATIQAIASYLDAFQKIADAATNSRGASKEIGTALTRVCLRHKAVETRMKTFTSAIMNCLVIPLQDKLEDWKRQAATIDKEHAKEYKRCRTELKKRSNDTLRLQKKARKGQSDTIQSLVDSHMHDVTMRRAELEDVEKKSLRAAMVEERMRYCNFVNMLQPVVKEECEVMSELGHLQEAMQSIALVTKEPNVLPQSSEELILESKSAINLYPESPGGSHGYSNSLGSRKSSVCSISSMNSSGSSGSPSHHHYQRSLSQLISPALRLKPGESSDSGFCSTPALTSQNSTNTSQSHAVSTWPPHTQEAVQTTDRPHTISSAYEKGHQRPPLTVYTFQNPETIVESQKSPANVPCRPPLPVRCSSLERPLSSTGVRNSNVNLIQRQCPSPIPAHITKEYPQLQPTYVNMSELASMAALKITNQQQQTQIYQQQQQSKLQSQSQLNSPNSNQSTSSSQVSYDVSISSNQQQQIDSSSDQLYSICQITSSTASTPITATIGTTPSSTCSPLASQNSSPQPTNNLNSPQTPITSSEKTLLGTTNNNNSTIGIGIEELKITEIDKTENITDINSTNINNSSPDNDVRSRGSVLEKLSMFEKLEQKQISNNNMPSIANTKNNQIIISDNKGREDIYKSSGNDKDPDQIYEASIQELNNLIGELDSFQREHELKEHATKYKLTYQHNFEKDILSNQQSLIDTDSDKLSIGSLNYSTQSTNASDVKFSYSDSEISRYVSESGSSLGFDGQNSTALCDDQNFIDKANITNNNNNNNTGIIYDQDFIVTPEIDYLRHNSEVVVLRCKDIIITENLENNFEDPKQRLSSFRSEQDTDERQRSMSKIDILQNQNNSYEDLYTNNNHKNLINGCNIELQRNIDELQRPKPNVLPRPASLSGCVSRIARRSSVNSTKPPPPVRRSSSVTPSHNISTTPNSPNLLQQSHINISAESLPPPPAFLLDRTSNSSPTTINVAETIKALTVIKHTPASPSALRRAQNQLNQTAAIQNNKNSNTTSNFISTPKLETLSNTVHNTHINNSNTPNCNNDSTNSSFRANNSSSPGAYAQPKQVSKMSSFRTTSPSPQKGNTGLLAQLNARLTSSKQSQQPQDYNCSPKSYHDSNTNSPHHQNYNHNQTEQIYSRKTDKYCYDAQYQGTENYDGKNKQFNINSTHNQHRHYSSQNELHQSQNIINTCCPNQYNTTHHHHLHHHQHQHHHIPQYNQKFDNKLQNRYLQQQQYHHSNNNRHNIQQKIFVSTNPFVTTTSINPSSSNYGNFTGGQYTQTTNPSYTPTNNDKTGSIRGKSKAEFLENLNAKLAKQGLSGRAFAVRNLINNTALNFEESNNRFRGSSQPDPRMCHESLMDQIKRGAILKRNRTINDRSAPKIH